MEITEKKENRIMDNHNSDAMELTMNLVRINSTDPGAYDCLLYTSDAADE